MNCENAVKIGLTGKLLMDGSLVIRRRQFGSILKLILVGFLFRAKCKGLSGIELDVLRDKYHNARDMFYRTMKEEFKFNLTEEANFLNALTAL